MFFKKVSIHIVASFKNDLDSFPVKISVEESGENQPSRNKIAKIIGRVIAVYDRSQSEKPGDFIRMVQAEIDNSFKDTELSIEAKKSPKPKSILNWMLSKKS
ncbi:MAG: hypothetical protein AAF927_01590 [Bacteroidota bacterium]